MTEKTGKLEDIRTGIPGFDSLIGGGFPPGSSVLILGDLGIGKTTLCYTLMRNLMSVNYGCVYVPVGMKKSHALIRLNTLGDYDDKLLSIYEWFDPKTIDESQIKENTVLVIDSASAYWRLIGEEKVINTLNKINALPYSLFVHTYTYSTIKPDLLSSIMEMSDVIIELSRMNGIPHLRVSKMRLRKATNKWIPINITEAGIRVRSELVH